MRAADLVVEVRDRNLKRVGQITAPFLNLKARVPWCGVGEWEASLPGNHPMVPYLADPGSGLIVTGPTGWLGDVPVDGVIFSGPTLAPARNRSAQQPDGSYLFKGVTDEILLADARAYPSPEVGDPSAQTRANDERTGSTESLLRQYVAYNIANGAIAESGPTSWAPAQRLAGMRSKFRLKGGSLNRGLTQTKSPRFQNLLELLREMVAFDPALGFRVRQNGAYIEFEIVAVADRRRVIRFDIENGTLTSEQAQTQGASLTRAIVGGQGEGTARTIITRTSPAAAADEALWGRVIETFVDQRDTDNVTELEQSGDEKIAEAAGGTSVKIIPADEHTMRYGDWREGDRVTAVIGGEEAESRVTETVLLANPDGVRIGAAIGNVTDFDPKDALTAKVEALDSRVGNLERASQIITADMLPSATTDAKGAIEIATNAEIDALVDATRAITPAGLGRVAVVTRAGTTDSAVDWNTLVTPGMYRIGGTAWGSNGPNAGGCSQRFGTLLVLVSGNSVTQAYFPRSTGGGNGFVPYVRTKWNASDWGAWSRFVPDSTDTVAGILRRATLAEVQARTVGDAALTPLTHAGAHGILHRASSVAQSIPSATWTARVFGTEVANIGGVAQYNAGGLLTALVDGVYKIDAATAWATVTSGITGRRLVRVRNIVADTIWDQNESPATNGWRNQVKSSFSRYLAAGTQFYVEVYQNSGAAIDSGAEPYENYVTIARLG